MGFYTRTKQPVIGKIAEAFGFDEETNTLEIGTNLYADGNILSGNFIASYDGEPFNDGYYTSVNENGVNINYTHMYPRILYSITGVFSQGNGYTATGANEDFSFKINGNTIYCEDDFIYGTPLHHVIDMFSLQPDTNYILSTKGGRVLYFRYSVKIVVTSYQYTLSVKMIDYTSMSVVDYGTNVFMGINSPLMSLIHDKTLSLSFAEIRESMTPTNVPSTWVNNAILSKEEVTNFVKLHDFILDTNGYRLTCKRLSNEQIILNSIILEDTRIDVMVQFVFQEIVGDETNYLLSIAEI